jgi:hypothetical protein
MQRLGVACLVAVMNSVAGGCATPKPTPMAATPAPAYKPYDSSVTLGRATVADPGLPPGFGALQVQVSREGESGPRARADARVFLARARRMVVPAEPTPAGEWPGVQLDSLGWARLGPAVAGAYDLNARQLAFRSNRWPVVIRAGFVDTVRVRLLRENCDIAC